MGRVEDEESESKDENEVGLDQYLELASVPGTF
jgi:hypothetical protein